jgi:hypothetical protein
MSTIRSRPLSKNGRRNWDEIFRKPVKQPAKPVRKAGAGNTRVDAAPVADEYHYT